MNRRPPQAGKRRRRGPNAGNSSGAVVVNGNGSAVAAEHGAPPPGGGGGTNLRVIAHRGHRAQAPENTLKSLRDALRVGARYLSVDIQLTADGVPVLFADSDLDRICGREGKVHDIDSREFLALKVAESWRFAGNRQSGEATATLAQAVDLLASQTEVFLFVEVKDGSLRKHGIKAVYDAIAPLLKPLGERVAVLAFDEDFLLHARERGEFRLGAVLREWEEREVSAMRLIAPDYLFCDIRGIPDVGRLSWGQAEIGVFEVDEPRKVQDLARRGVGFIQTFVVGDMLHQLARLGARGERRPQQQRPGGGEGHPQRREREPREPRADQQPREAPPEPPPALTVPQEDSGNTLRLGSSSGESAADNEPDDRGGDDES